MRARLAAGGTEGDGGAGGADGSFSKDEIAVVAMCVLLGSSLPLQDDKKKRGDK